MFSILIRPTSIKAVKLTYGSISAFFLFIVSHILLSYCEGWFNGVVAICLPHTLKVASSNLVVTYIFSLYIIIDKNIIHV